MNSIFSYESKLVQMLLKLADLMILNLLYVACCLPVITIGAATSAMYSICTKLADKNQDVYVISGFFKAFASNFRQATLIWLIFLGIGAFLLFDLFLVNIPDLHSVLVLPVLQ